jgi:prephenate dehydrogenase
MDVGSVKAPVVRALEEIASGRPVVGTHPVAGNERSGPEAAEPDLFRGALCVLTPTERTPVAAADRVQALWEGVGMRVERLAPERHDAIYAAVSHLPHAVAFSLVNTLAEAGVDVARYGAGSFKSATRVAGSSVEMCRDFLLANAGEVDVALARFTGELERLRSALRRADEEELTALLARARDLWRRWDPEDRP